MSARILLGVALRILGLWLFIMTITNAMSLVALYIHSAAFVVTPVVAIVPILTQLLVSIVLVFLAPMIAAWFYPREGDDQVLHIAVGPGDLFRIACVVLGVYLLVNTSVPAGRLVSEGLLTFYGWSPRQSGDLLQMAVYVFSGIWLVFGSRKIGGFLGTLRYDPDTIPAQRFSIAILFTVMLAIAIMLGVLRMLAGAR